MQLAAGVGGVVDAADAAAELEAQPLVVAQQPGHLDEVLAAYVEGDLAPVDDDVVDRPVQPGVAEACLEGVGDVVEPAAVGPLRGTGVDDRLHQAAVAAGVAAAGDAEHAAPLAGGADLALLGGHLGALVLLLGHRVVT